MVNLGLNIVFPIYNADGTPFHDLVIRKATYDEVVMSLGRKIVGDVYYKSNTLDVTMTEYIEYDGVQYRLVNPPTVVKEDMVSDNGEAKGMTKYSFTFYHPEYELSNLPFTDIAVDQAEIPYKSQDKTFYWIGNLNDFIAKLNANLVGTQWIVRMTGNEESAEKALKLSDVLSFDQVFIADALKTAYDTWEIPYTVDKLASDDAAVAQGKMFAIYFGKPSNEIYEDDNSLVPFVFKCGQGLGLKNDSRTPKNNKIVTRIVGHGSEDNIPYGYPQIRWYGDDDASFTYGDHAGVYEDVTIGGVHFDKVVSYPIYEGIVNGEYVKLIKHPFTRKNLMPSVYAQTVFNNVSPYLARTGSTLIVNTNYDPDTELIDYYDAIDEQDFQYVNNIDPNAPSVEFHEFEDIKPKINPQTALVSVEAYNTQGEEDKRSAESISKADFLEYLDQEEHWCELSRLVEDQNALTMMAQAYNTGENASYEKNGGATNVKWTLTFTNGACIAQYRSSTPIAFDYYVVEEVSTSESESESVVVPAAWDDTMDANGEYRQSYFKATLPTFNFDLYACASITQEMKLYMRSGACQGCTFEVMVDWEDYKKNFYDEDGNFDPVIGEGHPRNGEKYPDSRTENITVIVKKDLDTFGVLMPNTFQMIAAGDTFAILGISLPQSYITDAEQELDEAMKEYMLENNLYYFDYPLKFDEFFFAKHPFILEQMRMNTIVRFDYANEPTKVLYVKQMTIKWGVSPLPQYSITLTDDIDVVLNQIGRTTEDVSRLRVQMSEIQKYYGSGGEGGSGGRNEYLSRIMDDVAAGRITFQQGLDALGRVIFSDDIYSNGFVSGMDTTGRGWRIDRLGNAELESLRVRSFLEVIELLVNRLQAQEGDTLFTDNDQIEYVEEKQYNNNNTYYKLTLKEKWEGYFTALNFAGHTSQQSYGVIIKGIINTLAANAGNVSDVSESDCRETDGENKYYTSWMRVIEPSSVNDSVDTNQICVILYADDRTPARKNFPPCELMTIARWGCEGDTTEQGMDEGLRQQIERRQRLFSISVTDGRISKLTGVNSPILQEWNYGTTLGVLPEFINNWSIRDRLIQGRDYLYAQGVIVGDFIKVDIHGAPLTNYVDCGEWVNGGAQGVTPEVGAGIYLFNEYNKTSLQWETHDVWHNGSYWRCLRHQPVETTEGGVTTYEYNEPSTENPNDWLKLLDSGHDGQSAPYYFEESYAWSSVSSGNTAPQDVQTWSSFVPSNSDPSKPYLWLRSRKMTYNAQTNSYTAGAYTYTRMTGENGTGIQIKGSIPSTATSPLDWLINNVTSPQTGDCYIYQADGHLWVWNGTQWQDVGQIKGSDGANAYIHVAWAHAIDPTLGYPTEGMGFTTSKGASDTYEWMGVCANDQENDPSDPSVYEWNEIKGERGYSAIRLDLDNENDTMLYKADGNLVGSAPQTTWRLFMGSDDISDQVASNARTFSVTSGTCTASWNSAKKTLTISSMSTPTATIAINITYGGVTYRSVMSLKRIVNGDKYEIVATPSSVAVNVNDSSLDSTSTCNVTIYKTDSSTGQRTKVTSLTAPYCLYINTIDGNGETLIDKTSEYTQDGITFNVERSLLSYRVIFSSNSVTLADTTNALDIETIPIVKAANGAAGANAIRADLSNEYDTIIYSANGATKVSGNVSTQVRLYDGYEDKTSKIGTTATLSVDSAYNIPNDGYTLSGNTLTVSKVNTGGGYVTLALAYKGASYYLTFTVQRLNGVNKFELQCEPNIFSRNTTTDSVQSRNCKIMIYRTDSQTGERSLCTSIPGGLYLYYSANGNAPTQINRNQYSSGATFTAQSQYPFYRVFLLDAAYAEATYSEHLVDYETLPFITVANGTSPIVLELDNEIDGVPVDTQGVVRFTTQVVVNAMLYHGATIVKSGITAYGTAIGGVSPTGGSVNATTGKMQLTFTFNKGVNIGTSDRFTSTISVSESGVTYSKTFTLSAIRSGAIYNLLPTRDTINFASNATGNVDIGCGYTKNDNGEITESNVNNNIDGKYSIFYKLSTSSSWAYLKDSLVGSTYGIVRIPATTTATNITFVLSDATSASTVETSSSNTIDKEVIPILRDGSDGASPLIADLDNEMDSVSCDEIGRVIANRTITTNVTLYNGNATLTFTITSIVRRYGTSSSRTWTTSSDDYLEGVQVKWSGTTPIAVSIAYNANATITARDEFTINTQVTIGGTTYNRSVKLIVNGVIGDVYNLLPNTKEINTVFVNGSYTRDGIDGHTTYNLSCGYTKNVNGTITSVTDVPTSTTTSARVIEGKYNIFFRIHLRETGDWQRNEGSISYWSYNNPTNKQWCTTFDINTYDAIEFILSTSVNNYRTTEPENIIDRETVYVIAGGKQGDSSVSYELLPSTDAINIHYDANGNATPTSIAIYCDFTKSVGSALTHFNGTNRANLCTSNVSYVEDGETKYGSADYNMYLRINYTNGTKSYVRMWTYTQGTYTLNLSSTINSVTFLMSTSSSTTASYIESGLIISKTIPIVWDGKMGNTGSIGRNYYYKGLWTDYSSSDTFTVTDAEAPFFALLKDGSTTLYDYWVWVGANDTYYINDTNKPSSLNANWELMVTDFKFLITEAMFTRFAKLGSGVFNEDWMYSQYGEGVFDVWSGSSTRNVSRYIQVGLDNTYTSNYYSDNANHFHVECGRQYTVNVTAYNVNGSFNLRIFYHQSNGTNVQGKVFIGATTDGTYPITFIAEATGDAYVSSYAASGKQCTISRIQVDGGDNTSYEKISPSFVSSDTLSFPNAASDYSGSTKFSLATSDTFPSPFYVVGGKRYRITLYGSVSSTSAIAKVVLCKYGTHTKVSSGSLTFNTTQSTPKTSTFTINSEYSGWAQLNVFVNTSGEDIGTQNNYTCNIRSLTADNVVAIEPFLPKVAIDWRSGYAQFGGGKTKFNPDGSGHVANGNINWTPEGILTLKNGVMAGFARRVPDIITSSDIGHKLITKNNIYSNVVEQGSGSNLILKYSNSGNELIPDLRRVGTWMVFNMSSSIPIHVVLPFYYPAEFVGTWKFDAAYAVAVGVVSQIGTGDDPSAMVKSQTDNALVTAASYAGCSVEITNIGNSPIYVYGISGTTFEGSTAFQQPWTSFTVSTGCTVVVKCSDYGKAESSPSQSGAAARDAIRISWEIQSYRTQIDLDQSDFEDIE